MIELRIDRRSPVPIYRQIVDAVLAGISSGRIAQGDQLPTIRDLAVKLVVNPNTVVKAYGQLEMMGVIDAQQGSGMYVKPQSNAFEDKAARRRALEDLCRDFVSRAQLLNIGMKELLECLRRM
jgi:GntR family transcriptional regulator